jgi:hypothetical protein
VANDDRLISLSCCCYLQFRIDGERFIIDCLYDMVLGVQWLESLGPIL